MKPVKPLILFMLISLLTGCFATKPEKFASAAPVKRMVFDLPFPDNLIYKATPDAKIIIGKKKIEPAIYEISGFEIESAKKLWQLPFVGEVVGQTERQILVYEEKTSTLHFVNPPDGQIMRKISPAPNPLSSKNSLELGMAFTDEIYLTTGSLYQKVRKNDGQEDESFKIGYTAKTFENSETKWFVPPIKQIVKIEYRPVIFSDKALILNPLQSLDGGQTYQIIDLKKGSEIYRGNTAGKFFLIKKDLLIEQTDSFVRRIEPLDGKELWKIEGDFKNASVAEIADQITIAVPHSDPTRTIRITVAETGKIFKQFDLPDLQGTILNAVFITKDNQVLLNFKTEAYQNIEKENYNYWVGYDADSKKPLWRTDFDNQSISSLFPLVSDKLQIKDNN